MSSPIIAFVSVFLSLVIGSQRIEVAVSDEVAHVEILLNGELVGTMVRAPWKSDCDFGQALSPQRLEAIAFDSQGLELTRVVQWINLPRSPVQASAVIEREDNGSAYVKLSWANPMRFDLERLIASLDGKPLEIADPTHIRLPEHDSSQLHFLRVELEFEHDLRAVVEVTFGGSYRDAVSTDLTAVPILLQPRSKQPEVDALQNWFLADKSPVRVAAIEDGPAEIIMIRDQAVQRALETRAGIGREGAAYRFTGQLKRDQQLGFFWPHMVPNPSGVWSFPQTVSVSLRDGGVGFLLHHVGRPKIKPDRQLLADAVAVAAMKLLVRNRRRAVVLILGQSPGDSSLYDPERVRAYLEHLHVPLFVWSPDSNPDLTVWGEVEDISSPLRFRAAVKRLSNTVDRQRIVWLEGRHLPQDIEVTSNAVGVEIVH